MKTENCADVVIVGGGIAGLSVACYLARLATRSANGSNAGESKQRIILLEREELFATHSSGRNAAMFRHLDLSAGVLPLAIRSKTLLDELFPSWIYKSGALFVSATIRALDPFIALARDNGVAHELMQYEAIRSLVPALRGTEVKVGIRVFEDGIMDIHAICTSLADAARNSGAQLRTRSPVSRILSEAGRVIGVELETGDKISSPIVVNAAGAWARKLGASAGADLPLAPYRRHLASLEPRAALPRETPIVWRLDDEVYFRPESGGILASPCEEDIYEPCLPPESENARHLLAEKLFRLAPEIADAGVKRGWACLRTFAPDRALVAGEDPRIKGLFWIAGLGGHGMTAGTATGELVARLVSGEADSLASKLSPARLI